ncbi:MAG: DUF3021 family protein [Candidatus Metalachnospira sp.]|nr:DUF3021 family protein [Candidatus Metalachnospira sp.]
MNAKELFNVMFRSFFTITTGVVVSMYVFCLIFNPDASFTLHDIGRILLMAFASTLPFLIFYSGKELSKKQMYIRKLIHLLVLLAVLLYCASLWDWVSLKSTREVLIFILLVLAVYVVVFVTTAYHDKRLADKLNQSLKERYRS